MFSTDLLGTDKLTNNLEAGLGIDRVLLRIGGYVMRNRIAALAATLMLALPAWAGAGDVPAPVSPCSPLDGKT